MSQREWAPIIAALNAGDALDYDQSYWLMDQVMSGELGDARLASFLTAMAIKAMVMVTPRLIFLLMGSDGSLQNSAVFYRV